MFGIQAFGGLNLFFIRINAEIMTGANNNSLQYQNRNPERFYYRVENDFLCGHEYIFLWTIENESTSDINVEKDP